MLPGLFDQLLFLPGRPEPRERARSESAVKKKYDKFSKKKCHFVKTLTLRLESSIINSALIKMITLC